MINSLFCDIDSRYKQINLDYWYIKYDNINAHHFQPHYMLYNIVVFNLKWLGMATRNYDEIKDTFVQK